MCAPTFTAPRMAISFALDSPSNWIIFRLAALNRASRLIRRMHLGPRLVSYPRARKSERPLRAVTEESEAEDLDAFVVFEVEETLFKVHMSLLRLKIWSPRTDSQPTEETSSPPSILAETAKEFRFFLWDLQAFPHELLQLHTGDSDVTHVVDRLLNITEMAYKHKLPVLETHALESLHSFVLSPYFHSASSAQHCRCLSIAATSSLRPNLLHDLSRRLIHIILRRRSMPPDDFLLTVERNPRLRNIQGAIYYRQLIDMEYLDGRMGAEPVFPPTMDVERRMCFLAAHSSLSALSSRICAAAPLLPARGCASHFECLCAWDEMWAAAVARTKPTAADILGKLRSMTPILRRMVSEDPTMAIDCGLTALEAVVALRDDIIDGLSDHFVFP
ncbi:hypothetical protein DFH06DRAFT_1237704 [Mycena polygramma]|nr:hypothetical protein DFH06DRAFT_1237704 [Mycena polygramma]